jgi:signal transduction histidine kinase
MQQVRKLRRKLRFAGALVGAAFLAGFYLTLENTRRVETMTTWVGRTQAVLNVISRIRLERSELGNDLWAYRSTRDPRFSVRFASGTESLSQQVSTLQRLTSDNPVQQTLVQPLAAALTLQIAELEISLSAQNNSQRSTELASRSSSIDTALDHLQRNEEQLLAKRSAALRNSSRYVQIEILSAALLTQLVLGISAHLVQKHLLMRVEMENSLRRARELLGLKYQEQGVELHKAIENLQTEIQARRDAESQVWKLNQELEARVEQRTRELEAMNHELEAFSYSVSHDLRAPLRHMTGFAAILEEQYGTTLPAEAQHYVARVRKAASHMSALVEGLLQLARLGRQAPKLQVCSLEAIVEQQRASLQGDVSDRGVRWCIHELPDVLADRTLLEQVFANLFSNALKFTRGRSPAVIEIAAREADGMALVSVRDNGAGFDPQHAAKLFGVFQRLHRQDEFEGTGIGLATVQRIIQKHGGKIWAEAEPGNGASFYFTLPKANGIFSDPQFAAGARV